MRLLGPNRLIAVIKSRAARNLIYYFRNPVQSKLAVLFKILLRAVTGYNKRPHLYAVVNCDFPEACINQEAVDVIKSFSRSIDATFRFGVLIGGGGMIVGMQDKPFMRKTMDKISGAFRLIGEGIISGSNKGLKIFLLR